MANPLCQGNASLVLVVYSSDKSLAFSPFSLYNRSVIQKKPLLSGACFAVDYSSSGVQITSSIERVSTSA